MQLQFALDRIPLARAISITGDIAPYADWIEVGTSLIKRYGMSAVEAVVAAAGTTPVLADTKTADDAVTEFAMCREAGAKAATVLAATGDATLDAAVEYAESNGMEVVLDLLAVPDARRDQLLLRVPESVVFAPHVGKDAQAAGFTAAHALGDWTGKRRIALAGGLTAADLPALAADHPDLRVIIGSAVTRADDPAAAAAELRALADRNNAQHNQEATHTR